MEFKKKPDKVIVVGALTLPPEWRNDWPSMLEPLNAELEVTACPDGFKQRILPTGFEPKEVVVRRGDEEVAVMSGWEKTGYVVQITPHPLLPFIQLAREIEDILLTNGCLPDVLLPRD